MKKREDDNIQHLLGGYASGTLTPEEQQALFEAAMDDQELFDALANEQALKEILDDPQSRGYLRTALAEAEIQPAKKSMAWWWSAAGVTAVAASLAVFLLTSVQRQSSTAGSDQMAKVPAVEAPAEKPVEMAKNTVPAPAPAVPQKKQQQPPAESRGAVEPEPKLETAPEKEAPPPVQETARAPVVASAPVASPPPPPPSPAPLAAATTAPTGGATATAAAPSASILFLQPRAFGVPSAERRGALSAATRPRAQMATSDRARKEEADSADKAANLTLAKGPVPNAGIRYRIFRRNSQGTFVETRLDTRFEDGDEIELQIDANAPGPIAILRRSAQGWSPLPGSSTANTGVRSAPIRLERGVLELGLILHPAAESKLVDAASGPRPVVNQLTEVRGNSMYVVAPGLTEGLVAATVRIVAH